MNRMMHFGMVERILQKLLNQRPILVPFEEDELPQIRALTLSDLSTVFYLWLIGLLTSGLFGLASELLWKQRFLLANKFATKWETLKRFNVLKSNRLLYFSIKCIIWPECKKLFLFCQNCNKLLLLFVLK